MNSNYIKTVLLSWLRFRKQIYLIGTEVGTYNADVIYSSKNKLVEIEVKTSLADFKVEFKKHKHLEFKESDNQWAPNKFYFAVPSDLVRVVLPYLDTSPYGLIEVVEAFSDSKLFFPWEARVNVIKRAVAIHSRPCSNKVKQVIVKRLASELCGLRQKTTK